MGTECGSVLFLICLPSVLLSGLEEQLLGLVVGEELPELSEQRANLVTENTRMNKQLYDIESEILRLLSNSTGRSLVITLIIIFFQLLFISSKLNYATMIIQ